MPNEHPVVPRPPYQVERMVLPEFRRVVRALTESDDAETVAAVIKLIAGLKSTVNKLWAELEPRAVAWIDQHGPLRVGEIEYSVGHDRSTKCIDLLEATRVGLDAVGGDLDRFIQLLASNAYKYGTFRATAGEDAFNRCFTVEKRDRLKDGTPKPKKLQRYDPRFASSSASVAPSAEPPPTLDFGEDGA